MNKIAASPNHHFSLEYGVERDSALSSAATAHIPVDLLVRADAAEWFFWEWKRRQQNKHAQSSPGEVPAMWKDEMAASWSQPWNVVITSFGGCEVLSWF